MATAALGSSYVLSEKGAEQLRDLERSSSAPVSSPGFRSRRVTGQQRRTKLIELNTRAKAGESSAK